MSLYLGNQLLAGIATNTIYNAHDLFDNKWTDYLLNDQSWLRADTFSWQDGTVYTNAYNHLVADYQGGTSQTETVGSYTITYKLATDGHKITTDETNVANIYNESGVAWYYILDTANQRFKLPRTKYGFTGLRDTVGNYVPETLPNITGTLNLSIANDTCSGAFEGLGGESGSYPLANRDSQKGYYKKLDASRSSSTYQNNAPVQQRATQMYLYFYVGQFTQTATEQTAGLNSELFNGKVDLNAQNLSTQGKSLISGLGMPSDVYEDVTAGASGTTYQAPANGYFTILYHITGSNNWCNISTKDTLMNDKLFSQAPMGTGYVAYSLSVKKGDYAGISFGSGVTVTTFRFYYAEGEDNV